MNVEDVKRWGIEDSGWPVKGDKVVIPKGAHIGGTFALGKPGGSHKLAGRTQTVTVNYYNPHHGEVTWAGAGGYWHWTTEWVWPEDNWLNKKGPS